MIKALLDRVGGFLEKEFLFGSFLPALIFVAACTVTVAGILGFEACLTWMAQRGPVDKAAYPVVAAVAIVVFAYMLSGIRPLVLRCWSGEALPLHPTPIGNVLKCFARRRFLRQRQESLEENRWSDIEDWLKREAMPRWTKGMTAATANDLKAIRDALSTISPTDDRKQVEAAVTANFFDRMTTFSGDSLSNIYQLLKRLFIDWRDLEQGRLGTIQWQLDREYGSLKSIRATRLGNIIAAYTAYSYSRYGIEPEIFWPHLQTQVGEECRQALGEARTLLDFALNIATLGTLYFSLTVFAGPWLDWSSIWFFLAAAAGVVAIAGYRIAIIAADQFGGLFRASFDLYRLNLLAAFHRKAPATTAEERQMWNEVSQLVLYGLSTEFELTTLKEAAG
jgi:hypothetical protein